MKGFGQRKSIASLVAVAVLVSLTIVLFRGAPVYASDKTQANQLMEKAKLTFQSFMCDENMQGFRDLLRTAKGVMIVPSLLKGAFIIGASGGSGVLMVRNAPNNQWNGPAYYTLGGASFGLQIGGQASEVILLAMTDRGVSAFLSDSFKLGGDVGIAVGPIGIGAAAATANLSADIVSFSRSKGLYGGVSLDGAVVAVRAGLNRAYYGKEATPTDIVVKRTARNPKSKVLATPIAEAAKGKFSKKNCS